MVRDVVKIVIAEVEMLGAVLKKTVRCSLKSSAS
jgi:hypothetical protein